MTTNTTTDPTALVAALTDETCERACRAFRDSLNRQNPFINRFDAMNEQARRELVVGMKGALAEVGPHIAAAAIAQERAGREPSFAMTPPEVTDEDVDNILRAMPFASRESPTLCVRAGMRAALTADRAAVAARTAEPTPHPSAVEEVARAIDEASVLDGIARGDDGSAMFYAPEATAALADMRRRMLSHEAIQAARGVVYSGREWGPREMLRAAVDVAFGGEVAPAATIPTDRLTSAMRAHDATVGTYEERMAAALRAVDALDDVDDVIRDLRGEVAEWKARAEETRDRAGMEAAQTLATHSAEVARLTRERDAAIARAEKAEAAQVADFEALCRALSSHAVNGGMSHQIGAVRSVVDDLAVARLARPIPDALVRLVGAVRACSDTIDSEGFCSLGLIRETLSAAEAAIAASKAGACECKETECPGHDEIGKPDCVNVVHQPWCRHHKPHPVATSGPVGAGGAPRVDGGRRRSNQRVAALEGGGR